MNIKIEMRLKKIFFLFFLTSIIATGLCNAQSSISNPLKDITNLSSKLGLNISENSSNISLYKAVSKWIGTKYRRGGSSFSGVDCSGFTGNIYKEVFDKKLQRRSADIAGSVDEVVKKEDLQTGDLVFFATSRKKGINHVGVYLKDNKFAHASCSKGVIVSSLDEAYYKRTWRKGGRMSDLNLNLTAEQAANNNIINDNYFVANVQTMQEFASVSVDPKIATLIQQNDVKNISKIVNIEPKSVKNTTKKKKKK